MKINFQIVIGIIITLVFNSCLSTRKPEAHVRPNIVYILCDDLGYGDINVMSPEHCAYPTPNVDKLASEGMRFTNAHSGSAVCTPTRYGLLTGRYAWRTWLQQGVVQGDDDPLIAEDRITVAGFLKQQGYHTGIVGKWHLNYTYYDSAGSRRIKPEKIKMTAGVPLGSVIPDGPVSRGFDYFYGFHHAGSMKTVVENDRVIKEIETIEMLRLLAGKSVEYINSRSEEAKNNRPFFLYVPLNSPHGPIVPSEAWQGKSGVGDYGDFVMETDWAVGEILTALEAKGLSDNTLVIFTSDNGCSPIAKFDQLEAQGHFPSAHLKGHKADIWEGGHRVPFVVRWPGRVEAETSDSQLICHTDFMATCAEILDIELPGNSSEDGISFLPALFGKQIPDEREAVVHHSIYGKFAIRKGDWKLIFCPGSGGWSAPNDIKARKMELPELQLFNLKNDIGETKNVYTDYPEIVEEMTQLLLEYVNNGRSTSGENLNNDLSVDIWKLGTNKENKEKSLVEYQNIKNEK